MCEGMKEERWARNLARGLNAECQPLLCHRLTTQPWLRSSVCPSGLRIKNDGLCGNWDQEPCLAPLLGDLHKVPCKLFKHLLTGESFFFQVSKSESALRKGLVGFLQVKRH